MSMVQPEVCVQITFVGQENSGIQINHSTGELKPIAENNYLRYSITDCYKLLNPLLQTHA
jgi:hypothetical protein